VSGRRARVAAFFVILPILWGCTPNKVRLYESPTDLRSGIVQTAMSLHGKPYRNGAKGPEGFDCSGFVHYVYRKWGILLPVATDGQNRSGSEVGRDSAMPGDLVLFRIKKELHIGILLNRREFIHASKSRGVAVDDLEAAYWRANLLGFRSIL
jgi:cell wall-associated NlpC family hydrolase